MFVSALEVLGKVGRNRDGYAEGEKKGNVRGRGEGCDKVRKIGVTFDEIR
jgi:hypothetical protein